MFRSDGPTRPRAFEKIIDTARPQIGQAGCSRHESRYAAAGAPILAEAHQSKITAGHRRWRISLARRSAQRCTLGFTGAVTGEILAGAGFPDQVNYFPDVPL